jgi:hypothetical protein
MTLNAADHSLIIFIRGVLRLLVTANVVPSSQILVILIIEVLRSSETSVLIRVQRRHIPEDNIPLSHRRHTLRSYSYRQGQICRVEHFLPDTSVAALFMSELARNHCANTSGFNRSRLDGTGALLSFIMFGIPRRHNAVTSSYVPRLNPTTALVLVRLWDTANTSWPGSPTCFKTSHT